MSDRLDNAEPRVAIARRRRAQRPGTSAQRSETDRHLRLELMGYR